MEFRPSLLSLAATAITSPIINAMSFSTTSAATAAFTVHVANSGVESVNNIYKITDASSIPPGFAKVCNANKWDANQMWKQLNNGRSWLRAPNEAYIYLNSADDHWWIDEPEGHGVYIAPHTTQQGKNSENVATPPSTGWKSLSTCYEPLPKVMILLEDDTC